MFAIFISNKMDPFYEICSSFPTVIFTILLVFTLFYWLVAVLGMIDLEILDFDMPESDVELGSDATNLSIMAGLMLKLGLNGVPLIVVITLISLIGWMLSFTLAYFLAPYIPSAILLFFANIAMFFGVLWLAIMATAKIIAPLRPLFKAADQEVNKHIVGQVAIVRTGRVDQTFGEATVEDGGAGLLVKIRAYKNEQFTRGDRVVLLEYLAEQNIYRVISEQDFVGK